MRVYDDYAHHPTEIAAALTAARAVAGRGRLIAVFQPGTYSRTQTFAREFADAMALADIAVVMDIFPAREEPIPGVTGATITDLIDAAGRAGRLRAELRRGAGADRRASPGPATSSSRWASATSTCSARRSWRDRALVGPDSMTETPRSTGRPTGSSIGARPPAGDRRWCRSWSARCVVVVLAAVVAGRVQPGARRAHGQRVAGAPAVR